MHAMNTFGGETFDEARDGARLKSLLDQVRRIMSGGDWHTLSSLARATGGSEASISARIRDLRKSKFGGGNVERRYLAHGLWAYRMVQQSA